MRVAIFGASGFIGNHLVAALQARGDNVVRGSLRDPEGAADLASPCDAIVNLAGEPVAQRWTHEVKRKIEDSRTALPRAFMDALKARRAQTRTYVSASAIGYYGSSESETFTEDSAPGTDFLARVCVDWEAQAFRARELGMRVACIRTGLALGPDGGALRTILVPFKAGIGGRVASGKQWHSWIHVDDVVAIYLTALDRDEGVLNATAPNPVRNKEFTKAIAAVLHRPAFLPVPAAAIAAVLGEAAPVVTQGQRVLPQRLVADGFTFKFPYVEGALKAAIGR
ncbi:MAG: TIGR01777 family oxidoreductase [Candidatus Eremiobacteraeota bacterium]|nr:TIGR01777 family oxidoreductase [Candidatus Eremiobacteraeota bacterium]